MTRGQYIAMCAIGAIALIAYLESRRVAMILDALLQSGAIPATAGTRI